MKFSRILITAIIAGATISAGAKSPKRGLSENDFHFKSQIEAMSPGVSWFYTWGNTLGRYLADQQHMEFVPMCWNGNYNAANIRTFCAAHPEVKYLLGFNEPNFSAQANMTPAEAAAKWPEVQALAKELNLKLVAPALNYSPNPPYQDPLKWMDEFVALVGNDAFDYLAVHSYGGVGVMQKIATDFHERYGKDVWVTEFCYWPEEGNPNSTVQPSVQISAMVSAVEWLEKTPWIYRYAWFKAVGESSASKGPNYGLLLSGKGETPRELSEQGKVYVNMSEFDTGHYHPVNTLIPAKEYIASSMIGLGSTADTDETAAGAVIEVSTFCYGATLDYQFDVEEAGDYSLVLRVSGVGEPVRFDPTIGIYAVSGDTETELAKPVQFGLTQSNSVYKEVAFPVTLAAGRQTIRVKDTAPGMPSGIRISAVKLSSDGAGVNDILYDGDEDAVVDVYSLQGILLRHNVQRDEALTDLPAGIYIVGGKKIAKTL